MDKNFIEERKKDLLSEKERLEKQLSNIAKKKGKKFIPQYPEYGYDADENAAEVEEYGIHFALDRNLEGMLTEVIAALARIEKGTYGKCEECDEEINPERIKAYPAATTCIKCQAKREKNPLKRLIFKIKERKSKKKK